MLLKYRASLEIKHRYKNDSVVPIIENASINGGLTLCTRQSESILPLQVKLTLAIVASMSFQFHAKLANKQRTDQPKVRNTTLSTKANSLQIGNILITERGALKSFAPQNSTLAHWKSCTNGPRNYFSSFRDC